MLNGQVVIAEGLTKKYPMGLSPVIAVNDVSLTIKQGEFLVIVGPSGSGKTTLLNLLGTLDTPTSGRLIVGGVDTSALSGNRLSDFRRENIGFVFQLFNLIPVLNALENVKLPLLPYSKGSMLELRARRLLEAVGLDDRLHHLPGQLSGGEQQRVAVARALINQPKLILADEPTGNLDSEAGEEIVTLLHSLTKEQGLTVVLATHNAGILRRADRVIHLQDGRLNLFHPS